MCLKPVQLRGPPGPFQPSAMVTPGRNQLATGVALFMPEEMSGEERFTVTVQPIHAEI